MRYDIETWPISRLIELHTANKLVLNPPYQRNPIWSVKAQRQLIDTIKKGQPIPNFFIRRLETDSFEMVDGQQRARTIIGYSKGLFDDFDGVTFDEASLADLSVDEQRRRFFLYHLLVVVISALEPSESIEMFYALVNSTGLRLNRPELKKAAYYNTRFLRLMTYCAETNDFLGLRLFTPAHLNRMEHIDFVAELLTLTKFGPTDKKEKVDLLFETDLTEDEVNELRNCFCRIVSQFARLNGIVPLYRTRYSQRNDFYTLYSFILTHPDIPQATFDYYYRVLLRIGPHIRPSQEQCEPLMNYAYHCVTQSNSKNARERRLVFLEYLLLNPGPDPNEVQRAVLDFFEAKKSLLVEKSGRWTVDISALIDPHQSEMAFPNAL